jgi:uncharacterized protein (TIGR02646 family)
LKYILFPANAVQARWLKRAQKAVEAAEKKAEGPERQEYISTRSKVWTDLKPQLEALSAGKCWYSEARDIVSYWHVDHYRPKSLYPWLAFEWRNYRLCGGVPNVAKLNSFPLENEAARASSLQDNIGDEGPLLLDPVQWGDPDLLTFTANGEPACAIPQDQLAVRRVRETVSLLELDREQLCAARRQKWRRCETKLKELRRILNERRQQETDDAIRHMNELCRDLADLYDDNAEFTSTALACARQLNAEQLVALAKQWARHLEAQAGAMAA